MEGERRLAILEKPELTIFLTSDIHLKNKEDETKLAQILHHISEYEDAVFICSGDLTEAGVESQFSSFYKVLEENCSLPRENILLSLGNHDVRGPSRADWSNNAKDTPSWYENARKSYLTRNYMYSSATTNVYFSNTIKGYKFIVLNTEKSLKDSCYITDDQLEWLEKELQSVPEGKVSFIINHQPLRDTHWRSNDLEGFGVQDEKVKRILLKYPNVFFISGHVHNGFGSAEIIDKPYGTMVDVPSLFHTANGINTNGVAYKMLLYKNRAEFKAVNLLTKEEYDNYHLDVHFPLLSELYNKKQQLVHKQKDDVMFLDFCQDVFSPQYDQQQFEITPMFSSEKQEENLFGSDYRIKVEEMKKVGVK